MAEQIGFRLYIKEGNTFQPPALLFYPMRPGITYSMTFATGVLWRDHLMTCLEIRAAGLRVKIDNGMVALSVQHPDGADYKLLSFLERRVAGITDLDDNDITLEVSPLWRLKSKPIQEILRDSRTPVPTLAFLPHSQD